MNMSMNDSMSGYKKYKNKEGFTNQTLLDQLAKAEYSFGTPKMGKNAGKEAVVFEPLIGDFQVYAKAAPKKIEIGAVCVQNLGGTLLKSVFNSMVSEGGVGTEKAEADRDVEELADVMQRLLETGEISNSASDTELIGKMYMQQNFTWIGDALSVQNEDDEVEYKIKADVTGHKWSFLPVKDNPEMEVRRKVAALTPTYAIYVDGENRGSIKKKIKLVKPEINGEFDGKPLEIKGDMTGKSFTVKIDGKLIAAVDTVNRLGFDCYEMNVYSKDDYYVVPAFAAIIDNVLDLEDN